MENCWVIWKIAQSKQADLLKEVENRHLLYRNAGREKRSINRRFNTDKPNWYGWKKIDDDGNKIKAMEI